MTNGTLNPEPLDTTNGPTSSGGNSAAEPRSLKVWNLPNAITMSRLVLSFVLFAMIDNGQMWIAAAAVFIVAASTDFLDGYFARKYGQVTVLGRVLDPFVDKIIICGAFVFLAAVPESGICAWTATIVFGREMFITGLRSVLEGKGVDFSAQWSGKLKMVVQCIAVPVCLLSLSDVFIQSIPVSKEVFLSFRTGVVVLTVAVTVLSGAEYVYRAFKILNAKERHAAAS